MANVERFRALGRRVAAQTEALAPSPAEHDRLRDAVVRNAFSRSNDRFRMRPRAIGLAAAAVLLGSLSLVLARRAASPLTFVVGVHEERGAVGSWMSAAESAPLPIRFSDGTRASLFPAARARVLTVSPFGADVIVESGSARFDVVPRSNGEWHVSTGPFVVHVTGTRFQVSWQPDRDAFALELYEGHVTVSGCNLEEPYAIRAGERVDATCGRGEFHVGPIGGAHEAATGTSQGADVVVTARSATGDGDVRGNAVAPGRDGASGNDAREDRKQERVDNRRALRVATEVRADRPRNDAIGVPRKSTAEASDDRWIELAKRGLYADAFAVVDARGFDGERERLDASEMLLLADTARFSGHADKARLAYQSIRDRFSGSPSAALAAFQLGRDDFDRRSDDSSAEHWLRVYLDEAPNGALAAAATGRLMEVEVRRGNRDRARKLALDYLERFPKGSHAEAAHRVLGTAPDDARP